MQYSIFFLCLLMYLPCGAQTEEREQKTLDSLKSILTDPTQHDTSKIFARVEIGEIAGYLREGYWDTIANDCAVLLSDQDDPKIRKSLLRNQAQSYNNVGFVLKQNGETHKGLGYYLLGLNSFEELNDSVGVSTACNNLGLAYYSLGDIEKALEYYSRSLKIREAMNDKHGLGNTYNNLGLLYSAQFDTVKSLEYYRMSLTVRSEINDYEGVALSLNNIGGIHEDYGNIDSALYYYRSSFKICEDIRDGRGQALALSNIAFIYNVQGKSDSALAYYYKSLEIRLYIAHKTGIANSTRNIGELYFAKGQIDSAYKYGTWSMDVAQKLQYPEQIQNAAHLMSQIYEQQGDGSKALEMFRLYIEMRDKIANEQTKQATAKQQMQYEYDKQKVLDDALHEGQNARQKTIIVAAIIGLVLLILFLAFVVNRLRITRKQKQLIEEQKRATEIAHHQLEEKNTEILDSIIYAKRIQNAILPSQKIIQQKLPQSFILYRPKDIVAGDFYWLEQKEETLLFSVADCTGHGVPGALVSVICNNGLNRSVREFNLTDPGKILEKTREIVIAEFEKSEDEVKDGMDISLCAITGNELQWAGANNGLWIIRSNAIIELKADKQPIGKYSDNKPFSTQSVILRSGDLIYMYSDGYADQFGGTKGKKFKAAQLKELLLSIHNESMIRQKQMLEEKFDEWKGNLEQLDDVCVWGVKIN